MMVVFDVEVMCIEGLIGVWFELLLWKIVLIGIYLMWWILMYGYVFNVDFDLVLFIEWIIVCGFDGYVGRC